MSRATTKIEKPTRQEQRAAIVLVKASAMEIRSGGCKGMQWDVESSRGERFTVTVRAARLSRVSRKGERK